MHLITDASWYFVADPFQPDQLRTRDQRGVLAGMGRIDHVTLTAHPPSIKQHPNKKPSSGDRGQNACYAHFFGVRMNVKALQSLLRACRADPDNPRGEQPSKFPSDTCS